MIPRARIIAKADASDAAIAGRPPSVAATPAWRRVALEVVLAKEQAAAILADARARAEALLREAREAASSARVDAERAAVADAQVELSARWIALRREEQRAMGTEHDRVTMLAIALAERLLTESLALSPERIALLAHAVLSEARGARRVVVDASPDDAGPLRASFASAGWELESAEVREDSALARGDLRLHTDVGTIDARLAPRFERLVAALHGVLAKEPTDASV